MVISKKLISPPALIRSQRSSASMSSSSPTELAGSAFAGEANAFVKAHKMGRGVHMHRQAGRLERRPQEGDRRALAVRPPDMDDGRQAQMRIAERGQQPLEPSERQIQLARMQIEETLQHDIR